jgi:exosortase
MSEIETPAPAAPSPTISPLPWLAAAWFGALLVLAYLPVLQRLITQWLNDEDMGHGFFVPVIAGYIAWKTRDEWLKEPAAANWWGLLIVAWGALQLTVATLGAELFLARTAFVVSLAGVVLTLNGWRVFRRLAFPLFLLFFMVPIPAVIFNQITFPLQLFASQVASESLSLLGIPVLREGNIIELASQRLNVVEACSGIRSLLSLSFLSLVYGYFFETRTWVRAALFVATVPIAILANAARVTLTGVVSEYDVELARGFFHFASGWVVFMIALVILVAFHQGLRFVLRRFHASA